MHEGPTYVNRGSSMRSYITLKMKIPNTVNDSH